MKSNDDLNVSMVRELKAPDNPLLLLHTKVLLIKNIDAESFFTVTIATRQKMLMDRCKKIKRKITTIIKPTLDFLGSSASSSQRQPTPQGSSRLATPEPHITRVATATPS